MTMVQKRHHFPSCMSLATAAGLTGLSRAVASGETSPETNNIHLDAAPSTRFAPLYLAEDLLREEGSPRSAMCHRAGAMGPLLLSADAGART